MLVAAISLRYVVLLVGGLALAAPEISFRKPLLPDAGVRRDFRRYAVRMQVSGVTQVVNGEMDALVIGAFLPISAAAVGAFFYGEEFTTVQAGAFALALVGVVLAAWPSKRSGGAPTVLPST